MRSIFDRFFDKFHTLHQGEESLRAQSLALIAAKCRTDAWYGGGSISDVCLFLRSEMFPGYLQ
jgi:hypothetical protein